jgi:ElaA protein
MQTIVTKKGHDLMEELLELQVSIMKQQSLLVQLYLKKFYESHGFVQTSEMYLEDDIPHIEMIKE